MTVIRIDPDELEAMASLLDSTAGEYESLAGAFASPDIGAMPANVAGIVGQAYAEARSTVASLSSEFVSEARVLRFRGATAAEQGGLGCHLGSLGGLGYADTSSSFLNPFDTALLGGLATAWSGVLVGSQTAGTGTGLTFGGTAFTPGSTTASGGQLNFSSNSVMLGGGGGAGTTTINIGGAWLPSYSSVVTLGSSTGSAAGTTFNVGGGGDPGYSVNMPGATTINIGESASDRAFWDQRGAFWDQVIANDPFWVAFGDVRSDLSQPQFWGPRAQGELGRILNTPSFGETWSAPNGVVPGVDRSGDRTYYNSYTGSNYP